MTGRYRWALLAYPRRYRRANGDELADTANRLAGGRWSLRQWWSLLVGGLRTRGRLATGDAPSAIVARGVALGYLVFVLALATRTTAQPRSVGLLAIDGTFLSALGVATATGAVLTMRVGRETAVAVTAAIALVLVPRVAHSARWSAFPPVLRQRPSWLLPTMVVWVAPLALAWWLALRHHRERLVAPSQLVVAVLGALAMAELVPTPRAPGP